MSAAPRRMAEKRAHSQSLRAHPCGLAKSGPLTLESTTADDGVVDRSLTTKLRHPGAMGWRSWSGGGCQAGSITWMWLSSTGMVVAGLTLRLTRPSWWVWLMAESWLRDSSLKDW